MTLTLTQPYPAARPLPDGYPRFAPTVAEQRPVLAGLVAGRDWAGLSWGQLIEELLAVGRTDVGLARLAEGHVDGCRILDQAGRAPHPGALYGVWASRSRRTGLGAAETSTGFRLDGTLRFASGAGLIDRALVPVWPSPDRHLLVDLPVGDLAVDETAWQTWAMTASRTHTVEIAGLHASHDAVVGPDNFYLDRPAFFPGGVGVAACWAGGGARVTDLLLRSHPDPSEVQRPRLGRIRVALVAAGAAVRGAAALLDELLPAGRAAAEADWHTLATEARAVVAAAVEQILGESRHVTGPAGLALDADLAHAVADLELYVRQQNADADHRLLGDALARRSST